MPWHNDLAYHHSGWVVRAWGAHQHAHQHAPHLIASTALGFLSKTMGCCSRTLKSLDWRKRCTALEFMVISYKYKCSLKKRKPVVLSIYYTVMDVCTVHTNRVAITHMNSGEGAREAKGAVTVPCMSVFLPCMSCHAAAPQRYQRLGLKALQLRSIVPCCQHAAWNLSGRYFLLRDRGLI